MSKLLEKARAFYASGSTRNVNFRIQALRKLQISLKRHETELLLALKMDLGKPREEAYMTEIATIHQELRYAIRHIRLWARVRHPLPSLAQLPGFTRLYRDPYGVVLILSPWNYPAMLSLTPLISAVAAGNCAVLRPSSSAPKTAAVLAAIIKESFLPEHVAMDGSDRRGAGRLIALPFDKVFFTGSPSVGRQVMEAASRNLTPVTLELGGKSPAIVAADGDIPLAARRIVFGKYINAGQTCIAPDYVLVQEKAEAALLEALTQEIAAQYGADPLNSPDLARIVNSHHFGRLMGLLSGGRIVCGGQGDEETLRIAPTVLSDVDMNHAVMEEEIFGPILPVVTYRTMEDAVKFVRARPAPLAFYLFTQDGDSARHMMGDMAFGGGCVNDCILHLANPRLPFGGVGESGMGAYHGKAGFRCFSREKSVLVSLGKPDIPLRYAPRAAKWPVFRRFLK